MKEGSLMFVLRTERCFLVRLFRLIGFALVKNDSNLGIGGQLSIFIWKFEIGINLTKRRGEYVERIKDQAGPTASA